jgi:hypothetical protein
MYGVVRIGKFGRGVDELAASEIRSIEPDVQNVKEG